MKDERKVMLEGHPFYGQVVEVLTSDGLFAQVRPSGSSINGWVPVLWLERLGAAKFAETIRQATAAIDLVGEAYRRGEHGYEMSQNEVELYLFILREVCELLTGPERLLVEQFLSAVDHLLDDPVGGEDV